MSQMIIGNEKNTVSLLPYSCCSDYLLWVNKASQAQWWETKPYYMFTDSMGQDLHEVQHRWIVSVLWCLGPHLGTILWLLGLPETDGGWNHLEFFYSVWHLGWDDLKSGLSWGCQPEHFHVALHVVWLSQPGTWVLEHSEIVGSEYCRDLQRSCKISFNLDLEVTSITSLYSISYKRVLMAHPSSKGEKLDPTS